MTTGISTITWDSKNVVYQTMTFKGAKAVSGTLDNTAVSDNGDGTVRITMTAHGFLAGSWIYIQGTDNYDGFHLLTAVATNTFDITATYVAETPAGTEYAGVAIGSRGNTPFKLNGVRITYSGASGNESMTFKLDSAWGSQFDNTLKVLDQNALTYDDWLPYSEDRIFQVGDIIKVTYANTNTETFGIEVTVIALK